MEIWDQREMEIYLSDISYSAKGPRLSDPRYVRGRWRYARSKVTVPKIAHTTTAPPSVDFIICM